MGTIQTKPITVNIVDALTTAHLTITNMAGIRLSHVKTLRIDGDGEGQITHVELVLMPDPEAAEVVEEEGDFAGLVEKFDISTEEGREDFINSILPAAVEDEDEFGCTTCQVDLSSFKDV